MTIIEKLNSSGAAERLNGIITCLDNRAASCEEAEKIKKLESDKVIIAGRTIGAYATAVLDVLGIEAYVGSDKDIKEFIRAYKE